MTLVKLRLLGNAQQTVRIPINKILRKLYLYSAYYKLLRQLMFCQMFIETAFSLS